MKNIRLFQPSLDSKELNSIKKVFRKAWIGYGEQVQKFEKGTNGVSALKLAALAKLFKMKTDVIIDPNFIEYHRGFTAKAEAQEMQSEIINNQETPCQS